MADARRVDSSSLPLQATLYLHAWYMPVFAVLELGCLAFKGKRERPVGPAMLQEWSMQWTLCRPPVRTNARTSLSAVVTQPYPARNAWPELGLLLALVAIETARLFLSEYDVGSIPRVYVGMVSN